MHDATLTQCYFYMVQVLCGVACTQYKNSYASHHSIPCPRITSNCVYVTPCLHARSSLTNETRKIYTSHNDTPTNQLSQSFSGYNNLNIQTQFISDDKTSPLNHNQFCRYIKLNIHLAINSVNESDIHKSSRILKRPPPAMNYTAPNATAGTEFNRQKLPSPPSY